MATESHRTRSWAGIDVGGGANRAASPVLDRLMFLRLRTIPNVEPNVAALEIAARAFESLVVAIVRAMEAGELAPRR